MSKANSKVKSKVNGNVNGAGEQTQELPAAVVEQLENLESRLRDAEEELESAEYRRGAEDELLGEYRRLSRLLEEIDAMTVLRVHCDKPWQYRVEELGWVMREIDSLDEGLWD